MKGKSRLPLFLLGWSIAQAAALQAGEPFELRHTRYYLRWGDELHQAVYLRADNAAEESVAIQSPAWKHAYQLAELPKFQGGRLIPVPPVSRPTVFRVDMAGVGAATAEVAPERRWTVYLTPHTHLDVGFTERQDKVWDRMAQNLSNVIRMCEETRDWPEGSQYRWTIEVSALLENFIEKADQDEVDHLAKLIREGRVELAAIYLNLLTELCSPEELARALYPAERYRKQFNIPVRTAMIDDVPGYTWALPRLLTSAGVEFLSLRANPVRAKFLWYRKGAIERPFIWESPDGSRILTWYTDSYREANPLRGGYSETLWETIENTPDANMAGYQCVLGYLNRVESTGYPLDCVQMRMGGDNMEATLTPCHYVREWNRRFAYPRLVMATNQDFYRGLQKSGAGFPVHRGDIPDWWADGAASTAKQTGLSRIYQDRLIDVERFSVMADLLGEQTDESLQATISQAYRQLMLYDEHTWGSSGGGWDRNPEEAEQQWQIKKGYVEEAGKLISSAEQEVFECLGRSPKVNGSSVVVFNPLPWPRTDIVHAEMPNVAGSWMLEDHLLGKGALTQPVPGKDNVYAFVAEDVPAFGYKVYKFTNYLEAGDVPPDLPDGMFENDHYRIEFSPDGTIAGLFSKTLARELVDTECEYRFNQYIYESGGRREKVFPLTDPDDKLRPEKTYIVPEATAEIEVVSAGAVMSTVRVTTKGPRAPKLVQEITLYNNLNRILIDNTIEKEDTMDPEGLFFAFPFDVPDPVAHIEIPYAWMRPERDQLSYSARDFYSIFHWVDISGREDGVTWVPIEAPLVIFGRIRTDEWADTIAIDSGHLFSYFMNNYWFTNYRFHQGGTTTFRYVIQPHAGGFDPVRSTRLGWEIGCPLRAFVVRGNDSPAPSSRSLLEVSPPSVILSTTKKAEDGNGYLLRLHEVSGKETAARLVLPPGRKWSAHRVDVVENNTESLDLTSAARPEVSIHLRPHEIEMLQIAPAVK